MCDEYRNNKAIVADCPMFLSYKCTSTIREISVSNEIIPNSIVRRRRSTMKPAAAAKLFIRL